MNISDPLPFAPACERNKAPILEVLEKELPDTGTVLEIGSATGQHVVHFARHLPALKWQPADRNEYLHGLRQRLNQEGGQNILPPFELDVLKNWPDTLFDAVFSANTAHIMSWQAVCAMFAGVGRCLAPGGVFCLYGPFNVHGRFTSASNEAFDQDLRRQDPQMGLRDIEDLESLARQHQMSYVRNYQLPANNQVLVFKCGREKQEETE